MQTHYLESTIFAFAHAISREYMTKEAAVDVLSDMHLCQTNNSQELVCDNNSKSCECASHYKHDIVLKALDAALDNIV